MNSELSTTLDLEIEAVQIGIYCNVIQRIIAKYKAFSVIKIIGFSFVIKQCENNKTNIYAANNKTDLVLKFLSQAQGLFDIFCNQVPYILQAIDVLTSAKICELHEDELLYVGRQQENLEEFNKFTECALAEGKDYTDRQFLRELIRIV